jgi:hypothetical protein
MYFGLVVLAASIEVRFEILKKFLGGLIKLRNVLGRPLEKGAPLLLIHDALYQSIQVVTLLRHQ